MVGLILLAIVVLAALWGIATYNGLVRRKNLVAEGWAGIDTQLKRRADLIPNLVETVKGYASHESGTFEEVTKLRSQAQGQTDVAQRAQTEQAISAVIGRVMAVAESYPDLKASTNFQELQKELAEVEDQIQMARRYYNGVVRDFNTSIQVFPASVIAGIGGFKAAPFYQIENEADRAVPKVSFGT